MHFLSENGILLNHVNELQRGISASLECLVSPLGIFSAPFTSVWVWLLCHDIRSGRGRSDTR